MSQNNTSQPQTKEEHDAVKFLRIISPDHPWTLHAVAPDKRNFHSRTFTVNEAHRVTANNWIWREEQQHHNIYFSINPQSVEGKKAKKEDVIAGEWLWTDLDPPAEIDDDSEAVETWRANQLARVASRTQWPAGFPAPTLFLDSGRGYWLFWKLKNPVLFDAPKGSPEQTAQIDEFERYTKAVKNAFADFSSDKVHNADRVARLVGTINPKTGRVASIIEYNPANVYDLSAFPAVEVFKEPPHGETSNDTGGLFHDTPEEIAAFAKQIINEAATRLGATSKGKRNDHIPRLVLMVAVWKDLCGLDREAVRAELIKVAFEAWRKDTKRWDENHQIKRFNTAFDNGWGYATPEKQRKSLPRKHEGRMIPKEEFVFHLPTAKFYYMPTREEWAAISVDTRVRPVPLLRPDGSPVLDAEGNPVFLAPSVWVRQNNYMEQMTWWPGKPAVIENALIDGERLTHKAGHRILNLYKPPSIEPGDPKKAKRWLVHLRRLYPDNAEYMLDWFAHRRRKPHEKSTALVMGGLPGGGKDTLLYPVRVGIGESNFEETSPTIMMHEQFNRYDRSVIMRINEARDLGEANAITFFEQNKIRTASPPEMLRINEKFLRPYYVPNVTGVIITTNHQFGALYLPPDDRRHYVAWTELGEKDFSEAYFNRLWKWLKEEGGAAHCVAFLDQRDISNFNPNRPPKTDAWRVMVEAFRMEEENELENVLGNLGRPEAVTLDSIKKAAEPFEIYNWLVDKKNNRAVPHRLRDCGYVKCSNPDAKSGMWKVDSKECVVYVSSKFKSERERITAVRRLQASKEPPQYIMKLVAASKPN